jgi:membrane protein implicated in regulation of membrane protease activity
VLPPRLLDRQWQLQFTAVLINNAILALVAAVLMALAVWFNPDNTRLRARNLAFRRGAVAASLGFLLLAPLQGMAAWRLYRTVTQTQEQQTSQSSRQLAELRQAITAATTHQELQARVQKVVGRTPPLSQSELRTPYPYCRSSSLPGSSRLPIGCFSDWRSWQRESPIVS